MSVSLPPVRLTSSPRVSRPRKARREHRIASKPAVKESLKALGAALVEYRKRHGLSQRTMAGKVGCSWQIISHLECVTGDAPSYAVYLVLRRLLELP